MSKIAGQRFDNIYQDLSIKILTADVIIFNSNKKIDVIIFL